MMLNRIDYRPSSSEDLVIYDYENDYLQAEIFGKNIGACARRYNKCKLSLIDIISFVI